MARERSQMAKDTEPRTWTKKDGHIHGEWDVLTATTDGDVVWQRYGDGMIVIAHRWEDPDDALARHIERVIRVYGD